MTQKGYWSIKIDEIKMGDEVIASDLMGIVDTGTSLMVSSAANLGDIAKINIKQDCSVDPKSLPDVTFVLGGKD